MNVVVVVAIVNNQKSRLILVNMEIGGTTLESININHGNLLSNMKQSGY